VSCLKKNNIKTYIKVYIKTALTCFSAVTPSSGSAWTILTTVTLVNMNNALPDDGVTAPKHVGAVLM
jgi:hypothetical protein